MRFLWLMAGLLFSALAWAQPVREVKDDTGRTLQIPAQPQRVLVLHEALLGVPLLELGVNVVGAYGRDDAGRSLMGVDAIRNVLGERPGATQVRGIGAVGSIDLERVRALKPDLIIGTELDAGHVATMSAIAPVYLQRSAAGAAQGFAAQKALAALLGREAAYAALLRDYQRQLASVKAQLPPPAQPPGRYLAIFLHDRINVVGTMSGMVQAIEDLGLRRQPLSDGSVQATGQSTLMEPISTETFGRLNPDLLFVMRTFTAQPQGEAGVAADLDKLTPGWRRFLRPARQRRVVYLDSVKVTTPTVASARHTLTAIEQWLDKRHAK
ncbi:ABC transporter substrate-binding protein [Ottowia sp. GY511]|uniref:ABC transporter substrate-binding protein n=1 Tax=Ottowia flava TaxID=2675430 RepID=A0ABW4KTJ5_9BURK|nr:ABC transporter substrate-binding protein [Ottowia sp. GY511]TXK31025.1 ABC transporter substrate-binding protein [Ottowia sp. GY511]